MSDVRGAGKFAESGHFAFHTISDREGVVFGLSGFGQQRREFVGKRQGGNLRAPMAGVPNASTANSPPEPTLCSLRMPPAR